MNHLINDSYGTFVEVQDDRYRTLVGVARFLVEEKLISIAEGPFIEPNSHAVHMKDGMLTIGLYDRLRPIEFGMATIRRDGKRFTLYGETPYDVLTGIFVWPIFVNKSDAVDVPKGPLPEYVTEINPNLTEAYVRFRLGDVIFYDGYRASISRFKMATDDDIRTIISLTEYLNKDADAMQLVEKRKRMTETIRTRLEGKGR